MNKLAVLFTIVLSLGVAYGLRCYECDGDAVFNNPGDCGDTFELDNDYLTMCNASAGEVWCRKEKTGVNKVYTTVKRSCASQCEDQNVAYVERVTCCNTDGCNGVESVAASLVVILGTFVAALCM